MKQKFSLLALSLLLAPAVLRADPIVITPLFEQSDLSCALLALALEVALVVFIIRSCRLRWGKFFIVWYLVNVVTCFALSPTIGGLFADIFMGQLFSPRVSYVLAQELIIFLVEWLFLLGIANAPSFRRLDSKPLSVTLALLASLFGNLTSFFAYIVLSGQPPF